MSKIDYIMDICKLVATRSTCNKKSVGAIFVNKDYEILTTGYNGSPKGFRHCKDYSCIIDDNGHCIATIHAEQNAIIQAVKHQINLKDTILFVTWFPCFNCIKLLVGLGISKIIYLEEYDNNILSLSYLSQANIEVQKYDKE